MKPKNEDPYHVTSTEDTDIQGMAASDMTGLIPVIPETDTQLDSYKSILPFLPESYTLDPEK